MDVRLSVHATEQMKRRGLSAEAVLAVAAQPEQVVEAAGELPIAQSRITHDERPALLRVVFREEDEVRLVVTAYLTSKIEKYWQVNDED